MARQSRGKGKWTLLVCAVAFAVVATIAILVGGYMAGWDIVGWFSTPSAIYLYVCLGIAAVTALGVVVYSWAFRR